MVVVVVVVVTVVLTAVVVVADELPHPSNQENVCYFYEIKAHGLVAYCSLLQCSINFHYFQQSLTQKYDVCRKSFLPSLIFPAVRWLLSTKMMTSLALFKEHLLSTSIGGCLKV